MPKLARQYDDRYYSDFRISSNTSRTSNYGYSRYEYPSRTIENHENPINQPKQFTRKKSKNKRKKGLLHIPDNRTPDFRVWEALRQFISWFLTWRRVLRRALTA